LRINSYFIACISCLVFHTHIFPAGGPVLLYFSLFFPAFETPLTRAGEIISVTAARSRIWEEAGSCWLLQKKKF